MTPPTVTLIISTYNNPRSLERALEALAAGTRLPDEVVICDDGSGEETRRLVEHWANNGSFPIVHAWHEDKGFRKNRILNMSVAKATSDYIVLLDGDCIPGRHFVVDHRRLAEPGYFVQGRRAFIVEPAVPDYLAKKTSLTGLALRGKVQGLFKGIRWPRPIIKINQKMRGIIGCNLAMWRQDILDVNGFDEVYEGWGIGEDSDIGARLYNKGLQRKFVYGRALVYHLNHPILPRDHVPESLKRLQQTIDSRKVRCERGVDQYLAQSDV